MICGCGHEQRWHDGVGCVAVVVGFDLTLMRCDCLYSAAELAEVAAEDVKR